MSLADLTMPDSRRRKIGVSEERIQAAIPVMRQYIAFWRDYPDLFVDFMSGQNAEYHLYFYQRVFLRAAARHKYVYAVYPRASMAPILL